MATWIRNLVMLTVMTMWVLYVGISLVRHDDIDPLVWGLPGGVYFVLNPSWKSRTGNGDDKTKGS